MIDFCWGGRGLFGGKERGKGEGEGEGERGRVIDICWGGLFREENGEHTLP